MKSELLQGLAVGALCLALAIGLGCSKSTDSQGMTKSEQYEEFAPFLNTMLSTSSLQFGAEF
jgi:hypothetical protein